MCRKSFDVQLVVIKIHLTGLSIFQSAYLCLAIKLFIFPAKIKRKERKESNANGCP